MLLDPEHLGVRLVVPLVAVFACIGSYLLGLQLSADIEDATVMLLLIIPASIGIAVGLAWATEHLARRYWPSGRALVIDETSVTLRQRKANDVTLYWGQHINVLTWRFTVPPRRGRVQKGWLCMACRLLQDENFMSLYTFLPPKDAEGLEYYHAFARLASRKELDYGAGGLLKAGDQAQLHMAESERWQHGAELTRADFVAWLRIMDRRIGNWPAIGKSAAVSMPEPPAEAFERPPSKGDDKPIEL